MKITVKLFALLDKYLPEGGERNVAQLDVADGASVQDVIGHLKLPTEHCHLVLVNGVYVSPGERAGRVLKPGEALAIWPPVAGG
ncbi:MAG: MoaD/ThiS family protein [Alphaproteobacteria bacterium]|nr:MoaD/ThiS family protein [Alphaproteobacteria bacterium]MBF0251900.1 MoaD/ThiS family protein [Alphaproteobacteria bacterium]